MGKSKSDKLPKTKCCVSSTKCGRCPLRMLKEGTLPEGLTVKKRRLMMVDAKGALVPVPKKSKQVKKLTRAAKGSKGKKKLAVAA